MLRKISQLAILLSIMVAVSGCSQAQYFKNPFGSTPEVQMKQTPRDSKPSGETTAPDVEEDNSDNEKSEAQSKPNNPTSSSVPDNKRPSAKHDKERPSPKPTEDRLFPENLKINLRLSDYTVSLVEVVNVPPSSPINFRLGRMYYTPRFGVHVEVLADYLFNSRLFLETYFLNIPLQRQGDLQLIASQGGQLCPGGETLNAPCFDYEKLPKVLEVEFEVRAKRRSDGRSSYSVYRARNVTGVVRSLELVSIQPINRISHAVLKSNFFPHVRWLAKVPAKQGVFRVSAELHELPSS